MKITKASFAGFLMLITNTGIVNAQKSSAISNKEKVAIIDKTIGLLYENYIFPERVKLIDQFIHQKLKTGGYDSLNRSAAFLESFEGTFSSRGMTNILV